MQMDTYRCDRCGVEAKAQVDELPKDWKRIRCRTNWIPDFCPQCVEAYTNILDSNAKRLADDLMEYAQAKRSDTGGLSSANLHYLIRSEGYYIVNKAQDHIK